MSASYKLAEAAEIMGIGYRTAKAIIARNRDGQNSSLGDGLPAVKIGGQWLVPRAPLDESFLGVGVVQPILSPTAPAPTPCSECARGQHHGCVVWGSACGCGRPPDDVWTDVEAWARRTGRLR